MRVCASPQIESSVLSYHLDIVAAISARIMHTASAGPQNLRDLEQLGVGAAISFKSLKIAGRDRKSVV